MNVVDKVVFIMMVQFLEGSAGIGRCGCLNSTGWGSIRGSSYWLVAYHNVLLTV